MFPKAPRKYGENPWTGGKSWGKAKIPDKFDAACNAGNGKSYFFTGSQYWRWDNKTRMIDAGYPKQISGGWSGIPNDLDAATYGVTGKGTGKIYFFKGSKFWRWDVATDTMDKGYPMYIKEGWPGLVVEKLSCALRVDKTHIIFISGGVAFYWDMKTDTLKKDRSPLKVEAPNLPNNLDAALWDSATGASESTAFFKDRQYYGY